jgi:cytochrome c-type biogenesis protein CcmF
MMGFLALLFHRWDDLRSANQLDSLLSRESAFLFQNLVFVGITFVTIFGTLYPVISEALNSVFNLPIDRMSFAAPWFNKVTGPLFVFLIVLMGSAPLLSWRRSSGQTLRQNFTFPLLFGVGVAVLAFVLGIRRPYPLISFGVVGFVVGGIIQEFYRGASVRRRNKGESWPVALFTLMRRNQRRYGGYLVHLGVVMIMVAIIGANAYQSEGQANLTRGESLTVDRYELTYMDLRQQAGSTYDQVEAILQVSRNDRVVGDHQPGHELLPHRRRPRPAHQRDRHPHGPGRGPVRGPGGLGRHRRERLLQGLREPAHDLDVDRRHGDDVGHGGGCVAPQA